MIKKLACIFLISFWAMFFLGCTANNVIGDVYGSEHEYIQIGSDTYTQCNNPGVNKNTDRDKKLGRVVFRNNSKEYMTVWSLKGYPNNEYIYTLWVYDGAYYKKD